MGGAYGEDRPQDSREVGEDRRGAESEDLVPGAFEVCGPRVIRFGLLPVEGPIDLDDELGLVAVEIHDVGSQLDLPAKLEATKSAISKGGPKHPLGVGGHCPELATAGGRRPHFRRIS